MYAFQKAYDYGADGVELDIQLSKDGEVVIIHDETVDRTTNGTGHVIDFTLEELRALKILEKNTGLLTEQQIPTLKEYLSWASDKDFWTNIELKTKKFQYEGIEEKTLRLLKEHGLDSKVLISSFNVQTIRRFKQLDPKIKCGLLSTSFDGFLLTAAQELGVECVHPYYKKLTGKLVRHFQQHQLEVNAWTVNELPDLLKMAAINVNAVITDYPDTLAQLTNHI